MSISLKYDRHESRKGVDGALFVGKGFGYKRRQFVFYSYAQIGRFLASNPAAAALPDNDWHIKNPNTDIVQYTLLTRDLTEALGKGNEIILNRLDDEFNNGKFRDYVFDSTRTIAPENAPESQQMYAMFKNSSENEMALEVEHVRGLLGHDPDAGANPCKMGYYFLCASDEGFFTGCEVRKAQKALGAQGVMQPSHLSPNC